MIGNNDVRSVMGATVYDASGEKIGKVGQVYLDSDSGRPVWASVNTGLFGTSENFVPLHDATWDGEHLRVAYEKSFVTDAPRIDVDGALSTENQDELYRYYTVDGARETTRSDTETSRLDMDDAMNRQDEDPGTGTRTTEAGRVRLRKYVVTEEQTITVPVTREEVRVEWVPDSDADDDSSNRPRDPDVR